MSKERIWTEAQKRAIDTRDRTLLVSAAAGSGKTAVLTERIIRSLTDPQDPADLSQMLVVTFTRAAAAELRARIADALTSAIAADPTDTHLSKQLMQLGGAQISTIDSFYLDLVRANFAAAGMPASFRMADDTELLPLRQEIMRAVLDETYEKEPQIRYVEDLFCDFKSETQFAKKLLTLYERLRATRNGMETLKESADLLRANADTPFATPFGAAVKAELRLFAERALAAIDELDDEKNDACFETFRARFTALSTVNDDADHAAVCELFSPIDFPKKGKKFSPTVKAVKEQWENLGKEFFAVSAETVANDARISANVLDLLYTLLSNFEQTYTAAKAAREAAEFSDVSRAAHRLLVRADGTPTDLALALRKQYRYIYIDEYQDVDAMQDETFRAIAPPDGRFMVGDIKQSIYRFRGADPDVFAGYKKAFPVITSENKNDTGSEATVLMSDCFRCEPNVIAFSNTVSGYLFGCVADRIGYSAEDDLRYPTQKTAPAEAVPCRVMVMDKFGKGQRPQGTDAASSEAAMIAAEIARLLREEKKANGEQITPADIAVLFRAGTHIKEVAEQLQRYGIPVRDTSKEAFFENAEVLLVYSLLAAIDNPFRDIYLAATLRSPFFGFTLNDLIAVRGAATERFSLFEAMRETAKSPSPLGERCRAALATLEEYRRMAEDLPVDRLIREIYRRTSALAFAGADETAPRKRRANLLRLYEYARKFEASGYKGLYRFVRYVDDLMANDAKIDAPEGSAGGVSLITMHHAKGLEFPVCFVAFTGKEFDQADKIRLGGFQTVQSPLLIDPAVGCAPLLSNGLGPVSLTKTFWYKAVSEKLTDADREEEMRVLYVAMTRAKERLYVTGTPSRNTLTANFIKSAEEAAQLPPELAFRTAKCHLSWVLTALKRAGEQPFYTFETVEEAQLCAMKPRAIPNAANAPAVREKATTDTDFATRFAFSYPQAHLSRLPAKLSVSRLTPAVLDVFDSDDDPAPRDVLDPDTETLLHTFERAPDFDAKAKKTPAARGTATHEFLQFCDFAKAKQTGVAAELARLTEERFLPPETAELVQTHELERFFASDFYRLLAAARDVYRETRFNIFLPAARFTADPAFAAQLQNEKLLVQGVIDLFFTDADGRLVLCDYKTDRLTAFELSHPRAAAETLAARHAEQLSYYALALREICGKLPDRVLVYSLHLGEAVDIPVNV